MRVRNIQGIKKVLYGNLKVPYFCSCFGFINRVMVQAGSLEN